MLMHSRHKLEYFIRLCYNTLSEKWGTKVGTHWVQKYGTHWVKSGAHWVKSGVLLDE